MKALLLVALGLSSPHVFAFDFKGLLEKAAKDEKIQQQAKDLAKQGYEYFKGEEKQDEGDKKKEEDQRDRDKEK